MMGPGGTSEDPEVVPASCARRLQVVQDPATGWLALWTGAIRCWFRPPILRALAANPGAPKSLLKILALRRWDVRAAVVANPRCPRQRHNAAVYASDWAVRAAVASNPCAVAEILEKLIRGSRAPIRLYVAANPALTQGLADLLLADRDPYVRAVAAAHPAASAAGLRRLAEGMSEPAWVLRALAANPSCPADLSDQLLTWIALGGAGHADPLFDPLECSGHPGDTRFAATAWYLEQAGREAAEHHPLWRVRATVIRAAGRISADRARILARDPRPEVRRTIAGAGILPLNIRLELRHDADPQTARLASAAFERKNGSASKQRLARAGRHILLAFGPALVIGALLAQSLIEGADQPAPGGSAAARTTGGVNGSGRGKSTNSVAIPVIHTLPGNGSLTCLLLSSSSRIDAVSVTAGSRKLMLHIPAAVAVAGRRPVRDLVTVPAGRSARFLLTSGPARLMVTATGGGRPSSRTILTLPRCG